MADGTTIEWTHRPGTKGETWNPLAGCSILSPGCTHCYAMRMAARIEAINATAGRPTHYAGTTRKVKGKTRGGERSERGSKSVWTGKVALAPDHILTAPLRWKSPRTVFVNSMSDLFHEDVPDEWIDKIFAVMAMGRQHTFQVLTKRSARMRDYLASFKPDCQGWLTPKGVDAYQSRVPLDPKRWPLPNVWLGVSAERQQEADARIPDLLATPAAIRFVSAEPLLGPLDFTALRPPEGSRLLGFPIVDALRGIHMARPHPFGPIEPGYVRLDQIIVGGESGPDARPMHPDWARSIRDQCAAAGTAFFFKQWGAWVEEEQVADAAETYLADLHAGRTWRFTGTPMRRRHKSVTGRLLDGVEHNAFPEVRP